MQTDNFLYKLQPKAPPKITNLDVVEIVHFKKNKRFELYLRWQSPLPPFNGKLLQYAILGCTSYGDCKSVPVKLDAYCDLWENYICKSIQTSLRDIHVSIAIHVVCLCL